MASRTLSAVFFWQTPAGVLLKPSIKGMPQGEHAIHIHAVGKCEPPRSIRRARTSIWATRTTVSWQGQDMPNLHIPPSGSLEVELVDTAITIDRAKPNSVFQPDGTAVVIHNGKDDYVTDPAGNPGSRIACSVINQGPTTVRQTRAQ